jgi:hypothetical protein
MDRFEWNFMNLDLISYCYGRDLKVSMDGVV